MRHDRRMDHLQAGGAGRGRKVAQPGGQARSAVQELDLDLDIVPESQ